MWRYSMPGLRNHRAASFHKRRCRPFLSCTRSVHHNHTPDSSTIRRDDFWGPVIRPRGTLFFPPQKCSPFTIQLNSQWLAFCSSTWKHSPQHKHENCAAFYTVSSRSKRAKSFCFQSHTSQNSLLPWTLWPHDRICQTSTQIMQPVKTSSANVS